MPSAVASPLSLIDRLGPSVHIRSTPKSGTPYIDYTRLGGTPAPGQCSGTYRLELEFRLHDGTMPMIIPIFVLYSCESKEKESWPGGYDNANKANKAT